MDFGFGLMKKRLTRSQFNRKRGKEGREGENRKYVIFYFVILYEF